jgi:hypothetical protein
MMARTMMVNTETLSRKQRIERAIAFALDLRCTAALPHRCEQGVAISSKPKLNFRCRGTVFRLFLATLDDFFFAPETGLETSSHDALGTCNKVFGKCPATCIREAAPGEIGCA